MIYNRLDNMWTHITTVIYLFIYSVSSLNLVILNIIKHVCSVRMIPEMKITQTFVVYSVLFYIQLNFCLSI